MNTKTKPSRKRLLMELNRVVTYYAATALETKTIDTAPDGFRETPRKIIEDARAMID